TIYPLGSGNGAVRLTTARYFTPLGNSIQTKGIVPDVEVLQDVPGELKERAVRSEASLPGHLKGYGQGEAGSQSYIPPDPKNDKALNTALQLIRVSQRSGGLSTAAPYSRAEIINATSPSVGMKIDGDDVGYVRITALDEQATDGLKKAITDIRSAV